jgi:hypothetical protein
MAFGARNTQIEKSIKASEARYVYTKDDNGSKWNRITDLSCFRTTASDSEDLSQHHEHIRRLLPP